MNTKKIHLNSIHWGLVFLALLVLMLIMVVAGPAAQDQFAPKGSAEGDTVQDAIE